MRLASRSTLRISVSISCPFFSRSEGWPMLRVHDMSEMCRSPSTPGSSSTKAPKSVRFRTFPWTRMPGLYRSSMVAQGSGSTCFIPREMRFVALLTSRTMTSTCSPTLTSLEGGLTRPPPVAQLGGVPPPPRPGHLGDVNQPLDAGLQLDEGPVVCEAHDAAGHLGSDRVLGLDDLPRIGAALLVAQRHAAGLFVEVQNHHLDLIAHLEDLRRVADAPPGHVGHVQQPIDPAQVDEGPVVGDVLHGSREGH